MADEMDGGVFRAGKIAREREVRHVHPAVGSEIARDEQPGAHRDVLRAVAIACTAPARNQNCKPIWVTNGVKLKMSAAVPRFTARMIPAHARTFGVGVGEGEPPLGQ